MSRYTRKAMDLAEKLENLPETSRELASKAHDFADSQAVERFQETTQAVFEADSGEEIFEAISESVPSAAESFAENAGDALEVVSEVSEGFSDFISDAAEGLLALAGKILGF